MRKSGSLISRSSEETFFLYSTNNKIKLVSNKSRGKSRGRCQWRQTRKMNSLTHQKRQNGCYIFFFRCSSSHRQSMENHMPESRPKLVSRQLKGMHLNGKSRLRHRRIAGEDNHLAKKTRVISLATILFFPRIRQSLAIGTSWWQTLLVKITRKEIYRL